MPRIRWKASLTSQDIDPLINTAKTSIGAIQTAIGDFSPYSTHGEQGAKTTVNWPPTAPIEYSTTAQEHSEMVALEGSFNRGIWNVNGNGLVVANNGTAINFTNYRTNLPHCGYCTIMLYTLGLPRGTDTKGRYNLAVNLEYMMPNSVVDSFNLLARMVNSNAAGNAGWIKIKKMVNAFISTPPSAEWVLQVGANYVSDTTVTQNPGAAEVLDWAEAKLHSVDVNVSHFGRNSLLKTLWKVIYQATYDKCS